MKLSKCEQSCDSDHQNAFVQNTDGQICCAVFASIKAQNSFSYNSTPPPANHARSCDHQVSHKLVETIKHYNYTKYYYILSFIFAFQQDSM